MEKWLERRQYSAATAKQSRFKEAALAAQEQAAATEEGKTQAMMFALFQEQHHLRLEAMVAASKVAMEAMMERMNALVTAQGGRKHQVVNTPPLTNGGKEDDPRRGQTSAKRPCAPIARHLSITSQKNATSWK